MANGGDYEYDFFLSYPVDSTAGTWVRNHFLPVLREGLEEVGAAPTLFCWLENESGVIWPVRLKQALTRSRIMIAVLTPPYFFKSSWCPYEWYTMAKRQEAALRNGARLDATNSLITPVLFSDGQSLPEDARVVSSKDFRTWAYPDSVFRNTTSFLAFRDAVRQLADELISRRLPLAPPWSAEWPEVEPPPLAAPRAALPRL
jgi:hypothetical protein